MAFPTVCLHRSGCFGLSASAYSLLGEPAYVVLLYDAEHRRVGLAADENEDPVGYKVTGRKRGMRRIYGRSFCVQYEIKFGDECRRWKVELEDGRLVFCVDKQL